jgi:hypothetical protein
MPYCSAYTADKIIGLSLACNIAGFTHRRIRDTFLEHKDDRPPSSSCIVQVLKRWRAGENPRGVEPLTQKLTHEHWLVLKAELDIEPRLFVREQIALLFQKARVVHSRYAVLLALQTHDYTWKTLSYSAKQKSAEEKASHLAALGDTTNFDPECALFIDESNCREDFPREQGWGPKGEELTVARVFGRDVSHSLLAACNVNGFVRGACALLNTQYTAVDADRFLFWVSTCTCVRACFACFSSST